MKGGLLKYCLEAFSGGWLAAFFYLLVEDALTWQKFFMITCLAIVISLIVGIVKVSIVNRRKSNMNPEG